MTRELTFRNFFLKGQAALVLYPVSFISESNGKGVNT